MTTITATGILLSRGLSWVWPITNWKSVIAITLFLSVWLSAFAIVYTTYDTRHTFAELQSLRQQHDNLFTEWTQLLLEQSAWTDAGSIQQIANEELQMVFPATKNIEFLVVSP